MLDVTRLRVIEAVSRHGSVTAAAKELRYSQPSVSHHLARLEAETGAQLLQRVGRGIRLTPAGKLLADPSEVIKESTTFCVRDVHPPPCIHLVHEPVHRRWRVQRVAEEVGNLTSATSRRTRRLLVVRWRASQAPRRRSPRDRGA